MFEFEKMCRDYETLTYDERRSVLEEFAAVILPAITEVTGGTESFRVLALASCAADGKLNEAEYALFKDVTGLDLSYDVLEDDVFDAKDRDLVSAADEVVDGFADLDVDICDAMIGFCLCLCSADGRLSLKERSFIKKLMK